MTHDWDFHSDFCTRCGAARRDVVDGVREQCAGAENVVAVSHLIAAKRFDAIVRKVMAAWEPDKVG